LSMPKNVSKDRIINQLKELDLSTYEATVYATLITQQKMTASALCKETGIPDTKIYYALEGLNEKGMLTIQMGNPKIYRPTSPKEAIDNLKQRLTEKLNEKLREADVLVDMISPIFESVGKPDELEVAYIIRGQSNITKRMQALIESSRSEVTFFVSHPTLFKDLKASLLKAKEKRKIKLNIALTEEMLKTEDHKGLGDMRQLCCPVTLIISDLKTLITVSDWVEESAMLSQDLNLIRVARDYFDNSMCYTN
jgi:sugar-specific transcriptional regulator TrmB